MTDTTNPTTDEMIAAIRTLVTFNAHLQVTGLGYVLVNANAACDFIGAHPADSRGTPVGLDSCHARGCASWWCAGCGRLFTGGSCGKCVKPKRRGCTCKAIAPASTEDALDEWINENHFGEKCGFDAYGVAIHSEKCVETAFTDGYAAGFSAGKERA